MLPRSPEPSYAIPDYSWVGAAFASGAGYGSPAAPSYVPSYSPPSSPARSWWSMPDYASPTYAPSYSPSAAGGGSGVLASILGAIPLLGQTALSFVSEGNRNTESLRSLQYRRDVELAARGFSAGTSDVAPGLLSLARQGYAPSAVTFPQISTPGAGAGDVLAGIKPYLPLVVLALLAKMVLGK